MDKKDLKRLIKEDKKTYNCDDLLHCIYYCLIKEKKYQYYKMLKITRKFQYYSGKNGIINKLIKEFYLIRFNNLSQKYRIYIKSEIGHNLKIWHENIVVNPNAKIGNNVQLHGNNCIGNNGIDLDNCPKIGDNVEIGYGATIIGNIEIADGIIIGANSLVNKSFQESNVVIAGNPARVIKKR